jgi:hypothetical protein
MTVSVMFYDEAVGELFNDVYGCVEEMVDDVC